MLQVRLPRLQELLLRVLRFQELRSSPARLLPEFFPQQLPLSPVLLSGFPPEQLLSHPVRLPASHQQLWFHPELLWFRLLHRPVLPWSHLQMEPWSQPGSQSLLVPLFHLRQACLYLQVTVQVFPLAWR